MVPTILVGQRANFGVRLFGFKFQLVYFPTYTLQSKSELLAPSRNETFVSIVKSQTCSLFCQRNCEMQTILPTRQDYGRIN